MTTNDLLSKISCAIVEQNEILRERNEIAKDQAETIKAMTRVFDVFVDSFEGKFKLIFEKWDKTNNYINPRH